VNKLSLAFQAILVLIGYVLTLLPQGSEFHEIALPVSRVLLGFAIIWLIWTALYWLFGRGGHASRAMRQCRCQARNMLRVGNLTKDSFGEWCDITESRFLEYIGDGTQIFKEFTAATQTNALDERSLESALGECLTVLNKLIRDIENRNIPVLPKHRVT
jgi:hypothetical protein